MSNKAPLIVFESAGAQHQRVIENRPVYQRRLEMHHLSLRKVQRKREISGFSG